MLGPVLVYLVHFGVKPTIAYHILFGDFFPIYLLQNIDVEKSQTKEILLPRANLMSQWICWYLQEHG